MRPLTITWLIIALGCYAQQPKHTITVPAGTKVPVTLTGPLGTRSAQSGDPVRAETAFPVTVGNTVAIPAGTYVEGVIDKVIHPARSHRAGLEMHFERMILASGYTVTLSGATGQLARTLGTSPSVDAAGFLQTTGPLPPPTLPQVSTPGRNIFIVGVVIAAAGAVVAAILLRRHSGPSDDDLFLDTGSKITLVFQTPLTLDADMVAASIAIPPR